MANGFEPQSFDTDVALRVRDEGSPTNLAVKAVAGVGGTTGTATTTAAGSVKKGSGVAALAAGADLPTTVAKVNELIASLKAAGVIA